ncbi:uncharacterized protein A1O9_12007, partial [Exophiala aquamarina CBS 119918]
MHHLQAFPSISEAEFADACAAIEGRCADRLADTDWLSVKWSGSELLIKQQRALNPVRPGLDCGDDNITEELVEEPVDGETLLQRHQDSNSLIIDFSVTLSPTYCVPMLWFSGRRQSDGRPFSLDQVYEYLVPSATHTTLRGISVMGGISMTHHPVSDLPAFFIHPCNTPEALSVLADGAALIPEDYLILWLGLIGSAVGLHIPSQFLVVGRE